MIRKALKLLAILVIAIIGLFFAVAIVLPSSYTLERSIEISRPPALVYSQVTDYNTWLEWSPWPKLDPGAKQTVSGTPGTVGMSWSWDGDELGIGSMTIEALDENKSLHSILEFKEPMQSIADDFVLLEPTGNGATRVTWRSAGELPYPIGRYFGLTVDSILGPQYEDGLASLKTMCERLEVHGMKEEMSPES